jgi:hypothetical protein
MLCGDLLDGQSAGIVSGLRVVTRSSVALIMDCDAEGVPIAAVFYRISQQDDMDTSTPLIIIIVVLIVLGGGWYGRGY